MPLTHEDLVKLRRKYHRRRYVKSPLIEKDRQGPHIAKRRRYARLASDMDTPKRRFFTAKEIELMWIGVCKLVDYFGGNRLEIARQTGFSSGTIYKWVEKGRISVIGAYEIGMNPDFALSKEELRPDMSKEAWRRYISSGSNNKDAYRRMRSQIKNAQRFE